MTGPPILLRGDPDGDQESLRPDPLSRAAAFAVRGSVTTFLGCLDPTIERDHAGLVLPADFERSPTFTPVFDATRRRRDWHLNLVA